MGSLRRRCSLCGQECEEGDSSLTLKDLEVITPPKLKECVVSKAKKSGSFSPPFSAFCGYCDCLVRDLNDRKTVLTTLTSEFEGKMTEVEMRYNQGELLNGLFESRESSLDSYPTAIEARRNIEGDGQQQQQQPPPEVVVVTSNPVVTIDKEEEEGQKITNRKIMLKTSLHDLDLDCGLCDHKFKTNKEMFMHHETVHLRCQYDEGLHSYTILYSRLCGKASLSPKALRIHNEATHKSQITGTCGICDEMFFPKEMEDAHRTVHSPSGPYTCDLCRPRSATFPTSYYLETHLRRTHLHSTESHGHGHGLAGTTKVGEDCENDDIEELNDFLKLRKKVVWETQVRCRFCDEFKGLSLYEVKDHERKEHGDKFIHLCTHPECGNSFADAVEELTCEQTHNLNQNWFVCFVCSGSVIFPSSSNLREHLEFQHTVGGIKCSAANSPCDSSNNNISDHMDEALYLYSMSFCEDEEEGESEPELLTSSSEPDDDDNEEYGDGDQVDEREVEGASEPEVIDLTKGCDTEGARGSSHQIARRSPKPMDNIPTAQEDQGSNENDSLRKLSDFRKEEDKAIRNYQILQCRFCEFDKAKTLYGFKVHERKEHGEKFVHFCSHLGCRNSFAHENELFTCQESHKEKGTGEGELLKCFVCNAEFSTTSSLREHLESQHTIGGIKCNATKSPCAKRFNSYQLLRIHKSRYHKEGNVPFPCPICSKEHFFKKHLEDHLRSKHNKGSDSSLVSTPTLLPVMMKSLKCNYSDCGRTFTSSGGRRNHVRVHHKGQGTFLCNICGNTLKSSQSYKNHMNSHEGKKNHVCPTCGKAFADKKVLKGHERVHTGDRPYACHICDKKFNQPSPLRRHFAVHKKDGTWKEKPK